MSIGKIEISQHSRCQVAYVIDLNSMCNYFNVFICDSKDKVDNGKCEMSMNFMKCK